MEIPNPEKKLPLSGTELYERPSYYMGDTYYGYYPISGRSRDSCLLEESNFDCWVGYLTELLGPESEPVVGKDGEEVPDVLNKNYDDAPVEPVYLWTIQRASHFLCGWVETIFVHHTVKPRYLKCIDKKLKELSDYPVWDEDSYMERVQEAYEDSWDQYAKSDFESEIYLFFTTRKRKLTPAQLELLDIVCNDLSGETLRDFYESRLDDGYFYDCSDGHPCRIGEVVRGMAVKDLRHLVKQERENYG